jgi:hypothetical protein
LFTAINLLFLFSRYSDLIGTRALIMVGSSAWLLPAIFFPIASHLTTSSQGMPGMVYGLWYVGHVVGMTWWA